MSIADPGQATSLVQGDYSTLTREIRRQGLLDARPGYYLLVGTINLTALAGVVAGLVLLRGTWWTLLLAVALAVVSAQITFFAHDAAHRQIARRSRPAAWLCLIHGNLFNGLSYGWWVAKHNAHHAHPNDLATDPDVAVGALVFDAEQASPRTGAAACLTRHQALLFFPLLTLEGFNLHVASVRAVWKAEVRLRRTEGLLLIAHAALYLTLLVTTMTWAQAVAFLVVHQACYGLYLGCTFAPSHKGMPTLSAQQSADPLLRQVLSSRNIRGGRAMGLAMGGLNLQIEHHLFPSMPRANLRRARHIIRGHCDARGISYAETSLLASYGLALGHLHAVGAGLRSRG